MAADPFRTPKMRELDRARHKARDEREHAVALADVAQLAREHAKAKPVKRATFGPAALRMASIVRRLLLETGAMEDDITAACAWVGISEERFEALHAVLQLFPSPGAAPTLLVCSTCGEQLHFAGPPTTAAGPSSTMSSRWLCPKGHGSRGVWAVLYAVRGLIR